MKPRKRHLVALLATAMITLFSAASFADVLITKAGTRYEGQVLDLGGEYQLTDPKGGKMNFPKAMVARVEKSSTPAAPTEKPPTPSPASRFVGKPAGPNFAGNIAGGLEERYTSDRCTLPFELSKKTFLRGMWVAPNHESAFELEGSGVTGFSSWVGLTPGVESGRGNFINKDAVLCFEIYVDGRLRAQSGPVKAGVGPRLLAVDGLDKARTLRLATRRIDGIDDVRSTGVWADSICYLSDAPPDPADRFR